MRRLLLIGAERLTFAVQTSTATTAQTGSVTHELPPLFEGLASDGVGRGGGHRRLLDPICPRRKSEHRLHRFCRGWGGVSMGRGIVILNFQVYKL